MYGTFSGERVKKVSGNFGKFEESQTGSKFNKNLRKEDIWVM